MYTLLSLPSSTAEPLVPAYTSRLSRLCTSDTTPVARIWACSTGDDTYQQRLSLTFMVVLEHHYACCQDLGPATPCEVESVHQFYHTSRQVSDLENFCLMCHRRERAHADVQLFDESMGGNHTWKVFVVVTFLKLKVI